MLVGTINFFSVGSTELCATKVIFRIESLLRFEELLNDIGRNNCNNCWSIKRSRFDENSTTISTFRCVFEFYWTFCADFPLS